MTFGDGPGGGDGGNGDDREKLSWREIDKMRDQSKHASREGASGGSGRAGGRGREAASRAYRQKLDRLFKEGGIGEAVSKPAGVLPDGAGAAAAPPSAEETTRTELVKIARKGEDHAARMNALRRLAVEFSLPDDVDFIALALEHSDAVVVGKALAGLERLLAVGIPARKASLVQRLRLVEEASDDSEQRELAAKLRALLE